MASITTDCCSDSPLSNIGNYFAITTFAIAVTVSAIAFVRLALLTSDKIAMIHSELLSTTSLCSMLGQERNVLDQTLRNPRPMLDLAYMHSIGELGLLRREAKHEVDQVKWLDGTQEEAT